MSGVGTKISRYEVAVLASVNDRKEALRIEAKTIAAHTPACNTMPTYAHAQDMRFEMRMRTTLLAQIDAWRAAQPGINRPPRATAIKYLIEVGLKAEAKKKTKPEAKK
jgi:hypothetical protein